MEDDDGFVRDISDDEIEQKFQNADKQYIKPTKARPETAGIRTQLKLPIYSDFSKYVSTNNIDRETFCSSINIYITPEEMQDYFSKVGFKATSEDVRSIFIDNKCEKEGYLAMELFYSKLTCWTNHKKPTYDVEGLRSQADKVIALLVI